MTYTTQKSKLMTSQVVLQDHNNTPVLKVLNIYQEHKLQMLMNKKSK